MGFSRSIKLQIFLARLVWRANQARSDPSVVEHQEELPSGTRMVIYQHHHKNKAACVAVHGVTTNGGQDPRLIHFARVLAHFGTTCVVPTLGGMVSCRWQISDLDELGNVVTFAAETIRQPVGLIGFSFGGSYALLVASRSEVFKHIPWITTLGAYYDLAEVLKGYGLNLEHEPRNNAEWDETIYQRLVFLYGHRDTVTFSQEVWQKIEGLLNRYCSEASIKEKKEFYDHYLRDLDAEFFKRFPEPEVLKKLSPKGSLKHLNCPVTLIHDRYDQAVPLAQAKSLFTELRTLGSNKHHQLVLTSQLSHVSLSSWLNVSDMIRLANALAPLVP